MQSFTRGSGANSIQVQLDDDGNATVLESGENCAPGPSVVEASLVSAPYYTALATLNVLPPVVTPTGLTGYPQTSGTVTGGEVETGENGSIPGDFGSETGGSYVFAVFYVETDPVYAEQTVEISSPELQSRCGTYWLLDPQGPGQTSGGGTLGPPGPYLPATATLDDDGNAVFYFEGASCAAGSSEVIADVMAGNHPTYVTTFTVLPPAPTI